MNSYHFTLPKPCRLLCNALTLPAFCLPGSFDFLTCLVFLGSMIAWRLHRQSRRPFLECNSSALLLHQLLEHPEPILQKM